MAQVSNLLFSLWFLTERVKYVTHTNSLSITAVFRFCVCIWPWTLSTLNVAACPQEFLLEDQRLLLVWQSVHMIFLWRLDHIHCNPNRPVSLTCFLYFLIYKELGPPTDIVVLTDCFCSSDIWWLSNETSQAPGDQIAEIPQFHNASLSAAETKQKASLLN